MDSVSCSSDVNTRIELRTFQLDVLIIFISGAAFAALPSMPNVCATR